MKDGRISAVASPLKESAATEIDADGAVVSPGFVDSHIHLDKAGTVTPRSFRPGGIGERVQDLGRLKRQYRPDAVRDRVEGLAMGLVRRGVVAARTNVDVDPTAELRGLEGVLAARERLRGYIDIQVFAFAQEGIVRHPAVPGMLEKALSLGADGLGGHTSIEPGAREHVQTILRLARDHDVDVDFHVDENGDPKNSMMEYVIDQTTQAGYGGRVNAIHCCALGLMASKDVVRLSKKAADAGLNVTICPTVMALDCPLAPIDVLAQAGVNVSLGSDNLRDPINPLGTGDPLIAGNVLALTQKLFTEDQLSYLFSAVTSNGAATIRLEDYDLRPGGWADFVILDCLSPSEAVLNAPGRRDVFRRGKPLNSPNGPAG